LGLGLFMFLLKYVQGRGQVECFGLVVADIHGLRNLNDDFLFFVPRGPILFVLQIG
jgi:hypothetical protein